MVSRFRTTDPNPILGNKETHTRMSLDPTNEEKEIQDIVHELSQDIEKDRLFAKKLRKFALVSALSFVGITVLVLCGYLLYLSLSVTKLESEVKEKEKIFGN